MCTDCNELTIPIGPPGTSGTSGIIFTNTNFTVGTATSGLNFEVAVPSSGDYILLLEYNLIETDVTTVTTRVIKNGVLQTLNNNYQHRLSGNLTIDEITYTHNAKITAVMGDTIGFKVIFSGAGNGSLTIMKIS